MNRDLEPEREIARRVAPLGPPAAALALAGGALADGWDTGWSAAIGVAVVVANTVANGFLLARAARISVQALFAAATLGFVVRLGAITALMFLLTRFAFFSPLAFGLAVVPATILVLAFEMRLVGRGLGSELRLPAPERGQEIAGP